MVHAQFRFPSTVLGRMTGFHAILPKPQSLFVREDRAEAPREKKCLWFLHGVGDCGEDMLLHSHIGDLADEFDLTVILPDVENSFCLDSDPYMPYESYLMKELIPWTMELLPVSKAREDHFLGGISMGGYGAVRLGLLHPELFSKVFGLSAALDLGFALRYSRVCQIYLPPALTGKPDYAAHPDWDVQGLLERADPAVSPDFLLNCGERDAFFKANALFADRAKELGFRAVLAGSPGDHDWDYWRSALRPAVEWAVS